MKLKVKLVKSPVSSKPNQRKTVVALGLGKLGSEVVKNDVPQIRGMINTVSHLVEVTEIGEE